MALSVGKQWAIGLTLSSLIGLGAWQFPRSALPLNPSIASSAKPTPLTAVLTLKRGSKQIVSEKPLI